MNKEVGVYKKAQEVLENLEKDFLDIPFGNSNFQNKLSVITAQQTPARKARSIGLKMFSTIAAINELKFGRQESEIDVEEWQLEVEEGNSFDSRRAQIKINKYLAGIGYQDKLLKDAIAELDYLQTELDKLPKYTRESFEAEEVEHFQGKLLGKLENDVQLNLGYMKQIESEKGQEALDKPAYSVNIKLRN